MHAARFTDARGLPIYLTYSNNKYDIKQSEKFNELCHCAVEIAINLTFPQVYDRPSKVVEGEINLFISFFVSLQFLFPEFGSGGWDFR